MKRIAILGSTGSIGRQTLDVCEHLKEISVVAISGHTNIVLLREQIRHYSPLYVCVMHQKDQHILAKEFPDITVLCGEKGLVSCATLDCIEGVVVATNGFSGVVPTMEALKSGKTIYLANKEVLVAAGEIVMALVDQYNGTLIPIDSEHSSLFQLLEHTPHEHIHELILTASGGPFRGYSRSKLEKVTLEEALRHPTWNMGSFITVNSSTLMNKAFEVIEAYWLFGVPLEKIRVVVHPESLIHGAVSLNDGSFLAHLGPRDMRIAIQYALTHPKRKKTNVTPLTLEAMGTLSFEPLDHGVFYCIELVKECLVKGKGRTCYLNAVNEELVRQFLDKKIPWYTILKRLKACVGGFVDIPGTGIEYLRKVDAMGRDDAVTKKI